MLNREHILAILLNSVDLVKPGVIRMRLSLKLYFFTGRNAMLLDFFIIKVKEKWDDRESLTLFMVSKNCLRHFTLLQSDQVQG